MLMKKSLIAIAAAGVLGTGVAAAESYVLHFDNGSVRAVQYDQHYYNDRNDHRYYNDRNDYRYYNDRWNDGRNFSIDQREANMRDRIQRGIDRGRINPREARQLLRELDNIEAKERVFESDGRLGRREREELHADLDHLASRIRQEMRD
jgi:hypothetical protein